MFVTVCDRIGDTKVMFKCATAVTLCVLHAGSPFRAFPSQCVCVADRKNLRHLASARLTCIPNLVYKSLDVRYTAFFYNYQFHEPGDVGACCNTLTVKQQ